MFNDWIDNWGKKYLFFLETQPPPSEANVGPHPFHSTQILQHCIKTFCFFASECF